MFTAIPNGYNSVNPSFTVQGGNQTISITFVPSELTITLMEGANTVVNVNIVVEVTGKASKSYTSDDNGIIVISKVDGYETQDSLIISITGDLFYQDVS
jgi:hypothetical protein